MDIDRQIASLDNSSMFNNESPKILAVKITTVFLLSGFLTYLIKPLGILRLKYDVEQKKCSYEIIKKKFTILTLALSISILIIIWHFKIF